MNKGGRLARWEIGNVPLQTRLAIKLYADMVGVPIEQVLSEFVTGALNGETVAARGQLIARIGDMAYKGASLAASIPERNEAPDSRWTITDVARSTHDELKSFAQMQRLTLVEAVVQMVGSYLQSGADVWSGTPRDYVDGNFYE